MLEKFESKVTDSREKEAFICDLLNLIKKFQAQINVNEELFKLTTASLSSHKSSHNDFINKQLIDFNRLISNESTSITTTKLISRNNSTTTTNNNKEILKISKRNN